MITVTAEASATRARRRTGQVGSPANASDGAMVFRHARDPAAAWSASSRSWPSAGSTSPVPAGAANVRLMAERRLGRWRRDGPVMVTVDATWPDRNGFASVQLGRVEGLETGELRVDGKALTASMPPSVSRRQIDDQRYQ